MAVLDVKSNLRLNNNKITNLAAPTADTDATNKAYVDSVAAGQKWKVGVATATTTNINLSNTYSTIDGITLAASMRVLVKDQTNTSENGIYEYTGSGFVRAADSDTATELNSAIVSVQGGTTNVNKTFRQALVVATLDTDSITWEVFGSAVSDASQTQKGAVRLATQEEVNAGSSTILAISPATLKGSVYAPKKFASTIGDNNSTSFTVTHNLGTTDVSVNVIDLATKSSILTQVDVLTINTVQIQFAVKPAADSHRVIVLA